MLADCLSLARPLRSYSIFSKSAQLTHIKFRAPLPNTTRSHVQRFSSRTSLYDIFAKTAICAIIRCNFQLLLGIVEQTALKVSTVKFNFCALKRFAFTFAYNLLFFHLNFYSFNQSHHAIWWTQNITKQYARHLYALRSTPFADIFNVFSSLQHLHSSQAGTAYSE